MLNQSYATDHVIFVDTSAIAAVLNKDDSRHKNADVYYQKIVDQGYSLVLTNFIIAETHALLLKETHNIPLCLRWLQTVAYEDYYVIRPTEKDEEKAIALLSTYADKQWSLTDAISFTIMERLHIPYYFSFDDDFKQIGKFLDITGYLNRN